MAHNSSIYQHEMTRGRKRRNSEDEEMGEYENSSKSVMRKIKSIDLKRQKINSQKRTTRSALLDTMDKESVIDIINSLLKSHPEVKEDIINYIPAPTIFSSMNVLIDMEKKFIHSFPFNKNGPGRDDYTFSRVREAYIDLIDTITQYANHFTTSVQVLPSTCFAFLDHATQMAHRLPTWDNENNNKYKHELYQDLNDFWKLAIQTTSSNLRQNEIYNPSSVSEWAKNLAQHNSITNGYFTEAVHEFSRKLGYLIGLNETTTTPLCHLPPLETTLTSPSVVGDRR
jgi:hypothetical protein